MNENSQNDFSLNPWIEWCRLCSKENAEINVNDERDINISSAIALYFCINITPEDRLSKKICNQCLDFVNAILKFESRVCKVQKMFTYLQNLNEKDSVDTVEVRLKFDLIDESTTSVHSKSSIIRKYETEVNDSSVMEYSATNKDHGNSDNEDDRMEWNTKKLIKRSDSSDEDKTLGEIKRLKLQVDSAEKNITSSNEKYIKISSYPTADVLKRKFSCKLCSRSFNNQCYYRQHMRRTHKKELDIPRYECDQCGKTFPTELQIRNHIKTHLPLELKQEYPCVYCDKKFTTPYVMQKHISAVHLNEKPYICEECGLAVKSSSSLKVHMLTHTDDRPWHCNICNKGFKNRVGLKRHMDGHSSNKHICSECGCQLNSRASLKRHMVIHCDDKLHKCDYCGRDFKRAEALKHHLILHTGLKPYPCNFCSKVFANGSNCRAHKKKSHPEELAALEASGESIIVNKNIPKLKQLKAITKTSDNLKPVISKQNGSSSLVKINKSASSKV